MPVPNEPSVFRSDEDAALILEIVQANFDGSGPNEEARILLRRLMGQNPVANDSVPIDLHLTSDTGPFRGLVEEICSRLRANQPTTLNRTRDLDGHVSIVLANLFRNFLRGDRHTAYSRNTNRYRTHSRYNAMRIGYRPMMHVVDGLKTLGFIETVLGNYDRNLGSGLTSRMRARPVLIGQMLTTLGANLIILSKSDEQEVIILRDKNKKNIEYDDTEDTLRMREFVRTYNEALNDTEIDIPEPYRTEAERGKILEDNSGRASPFIVDDTTKATCRIFNRSSFDYGGRFWRSWWQRIPSEYRQHITIDGEPTVELDYSAMQVHLLYSLQNISYAEVYGPDDDPYTLEGYESSARDILKVALLIALNCQTQAQALRAIQKKIREDMGQAHLRQFDIPGLIDAFTHKHSRIADCLYSDIGVSLQRTESNITEYILKELLQEEIICLNIHDSFIVKEDHKYKLMNEMNNAFEYFDLISKPKIH